MRKYTLILTFLMIVNAVPVFFLAQKGVSKTAKPYSAEGNAFAPRNQHALIIAINDYMYLDDLKKAVPEAKRVKRLLENRYGYLPGKITTFFDIEATRNALMRQLRWYVKNLAEVDSLFIYFSGHGYEDNILKKGFWMPYDAGADWPKEKAGPREAIDTVISISNYDIVAVLKHCKARHIFVVADSCFSAQFFAPQSKVTKAPMEHQKRKSRQLFASGRQLVGDGQFGKYFCDFMELHEEPFLLATDLVSGVRNMVMSNTDLEPEGKPVKSTGHLGGDFVFILKSESRSQKLKAEAQALKKKLKILEQNKISIKKALLEKEKRAKEREAAELRSKILAKKLERKQINEDEKRRQRLKTQEVKIRKELELQRQERAKRDADTKMELDLLRQKIKFEQDEISVAKYKLLSQDAALKEVKSLKTSVKRITEAINSKKKKAIARLDSDYKSLKALVNKPLSPWRQFESRAHYQQRKKERQDKINSVEELYRKDLGGIQKQFYNRIQNQTKVYRKRIKTLTSRRLPVENPTVELLKYDPRSEIYDIRITSNGNPKKSWLIPFEIDNDSATEMYHRRKFLKVEAFYGNLYDSTFLNQVILTDHFLGRIKLLKRKIFRSASEVFPFLATYGYKDIEFQAGNPSQSNSKLIKLTESEYANLLRKFIINKDRVVVDFNSGLMWYPCQEKHTELGCGSTPRPRNYAAFDDWRLPTFDEAVSLSEIASTETSFFQTLFHPNETIPLERVPIFTSDLAKTQSEDCFPIIKNLIAKKENLEYYTGGGCYVYFVRYIYSDHLGYRNAL